MQSRGGERKVDGAARRGAREEAIKVSRIFRVNIVVAAARRERTKTAEAEEEAAQAEAEAVEGGGGEGGGESGVGNKGKTSGEA